MDCKPLLDAIRDNIRQVIVGKDRVIDHLLISLLCSGHVLIEDMPGLGKTTLVSALAASLGCSFRRIQFTPDVLPSDITGFTMFNLKTGEQELHPGSIMHQIVLADEINRTSPKTQSALLEVMQENQVTIDGKTYPAPPLSWSWRPRTRWKWRERIRCLKHSSTAFLCEFPWGIPLMGRSSKSCITTGPARRR